jgi:hypothetical protein
MINAIRKKSVLPVMAEKFGRRQGMRKQQSIHVD